jgi:hypothetical protein
MSEYIIIKKDDIEHFSRIDEFYKGTIPVKQLMLLDCNFKEKLEDAFNEGIKYAESNVRVDYPFNRYYNDRYGSN